MTDNEYEKRNAEIEKHWQRALKPLHAMINREESFVRWMEESLKHKPEALTAFYKWAGIDPKSRPATD